MFRILVMTAVCAVSTFQNSIRPNKDALLVNHPNKWRGGSSRGDSGEEIKRPWHKAGDNAGERQLHNDNAYVESFGKNAVMMDTNGAKNIGSSEQKDGIIEGILKDDASLWQWLKGRYGDARVDAQDSNALLTGKLDTANKDDSDWAMKDSHDDGGNSAAHFRKMIGQNMDDSSEEMNMLKRKAESSDGAFVQWLKGRYGDSAIKEIKPQGRRGDARENVQWLKGRYGDSKGQLLGKRGALSNFNLVRRRGIYVDGTGSTQWLKGQYGDSREWNLRRPLSRRGDPGETELRRRDTNSDSSERMMMKEDTSEKIPGVRNGDAKEMLDVYETQNGEYTRHPQRMGWGKGNGDAQSEG